LGDLIGAADGRPGGEVTARDCLAGLGELPERVDDGAEEQAAHDQGHGEGGQGGSQQRRADAGEESLLFYTQGGHRRDGIGENVPDHFPVDQYLNPRLQVPAGGGPVRGPTRIRHNSARRVRYPEIHRPLAARGPHPRVHHPGPREDRQGLLQAVPRAVGNVVFRQRDRYPLPQPAPGQRIAAKFLLRRPAHQRCHPADGDHDDGQKGQHPLPEQTTHHRPRDSADTPPPRRSE
jgi:hypothetical protein